VHSTFEDGELTCDAIRGKRDSPPSHVPGGHTIHQWPGKVQQARLNTILLASRR
jgi:hypothetical protein